MAKATWGDWVGTVLGYIRIGIAGPRLKNSSGNLVIRNAADSADAQVLPQSLGTGTRDGTKFLRDDGTWQATSGSSTSWPTVKNTVASGETVTVSANTQLIVQEGFYVDAGGSVTLDGRIVVL